MKLSIKSFDVKMEVKNKGVEFEVRKPNGDFLGDFVLTSTGLTWCKGRTKPENGVKVKWDKLIEWMETQTTRTSGRGRRGPGQPTPT